MPQFDDDIYLGPVARGGANSAGSSPMSRGVGPLGRVYVLDIVPIALSTTAICAAQAIAGAGNALINGASATAGVATLDHSRALQMVSSNAGDTTQTVTVYGIDIYGQSVSQIKTLNGVTPVLFTKAFKTITRVAVSAALAGNLTVGNRDVYGFPVAVTNVGYLLRVGWDGVLAENAATVTVADATSPATTSTTDVRGLIAPAGNAADGTRRLVVAIGLSAIQVGPNATRAGAVGVDQV